MHISNNKLQELQVKLETASQELKYAGTARGVSQATLKIQNIQTEINTILNKFNDELAKPISNKVSRLQIQKKIVANEGLLKTAYTIRNKAAEILSLKNQAISYERVGGLDLLHQHHIENPKAQQVISQFQNASRGHPPEIKEAIFAIVQKVDIIKVRGGQVMHERVNGKTMEFLVFKGANGLEVLPRLGKAQGNDSAIYLKGDKIVKVPSQSAGAKEALVKEFKLYQKMGNQSVRMMTFDDGSMGLEMTRFKGSFDEQVILHQFAKLCGLKSEQLRNASPVEKDKLIKKGFAKLSADKLNAFASRYNKQPGDLLEGLKRDYIPFNRHQRQAMCDQMIRGFQELSDREIVHGDIKAQNVLWKEDESTGAMQFQLSDFGRSIIREERRAAHELLASFCLPDPSTKAVVNLAYLFGKAAPDLPEKSLEETLKAFVDTGLMIQLPDGRLQPDAKSISALMSLPNNFNQLKPEEQQAIKEYRDKIRSDLSQKGLISLDAKRPAFRISEASMNLLLSMASIANNPIEGEATTAYLDQNTLDWASFFAKSGSPANMLAAVDSVQQFALGASLYEMVTGFNIPREGSTTKAIDQAKMKSMANRLTELGIKKETVEKITAMLKPSAPSPDKVLAYVQAKMIAKLSGEKLDKALGEARTIVNDLYRTYPELSDAYVRLVEKWGKPELDAKNLIFIPKKDL